MSVCTNCGHDRMFHHTADLTPEPCGKDGCGCRSEFANYAKAMASQINADVTDVKAAIDAVLVRVGAIGFVVTEGEKERARLQELLDGLQAIEITRGKDLSLAQQERERSNAVRNERDQARVGYAQLVLNGVSEGKIDKDAPARQWFDDAKATIADAGRYQECLAFVQARGFDTVADYFAAHPVAEA
jgi:hypothetical protein